MRLRKVVEDAARTQPTQPGVELVVSITDDVTDTVFLDETYIFRVRCRVSKEIVTGLTVEHNVSGTHERGSYRQQSSPHFADEVCCSSCPTHRSSARRAT